MVQHCLVDWAWVGGAREGGESGGLSESQKLFSCPEVVQGGFGEEVGLVGSFSSLRALK